MIVFFLNPRALLDHYVGIQDPDARDKIWIAVWI